MKIAIALIALLALAGCTNKEDAERALTAEGFTDVQVVGYDWFGCGDDDWYATKFTATNRDGKPVRGTVCSGLFMKSATVRW